jgi:hypothetical protein
MFGDPYRLSAPESDFWSGFVVLSMFLPRPLTTVGEKNQSGLLFLYGVA